MQQMWLAHAHFLVLLPLISFLLFGALEGGIPESVCFLPNILEHHWYVEEFFFNKGNLPFSFILTRSHFKHCRFCGQFTFLASQRKKLLAQDINIGTVCLVHLSLPYVLCVKSWAALCSHSLSVQLVSLLGSILRRSFNVKSRSLAIFYNNTF